VPPAIRFTKKRKAVGRARPTGGGFFRGPGRKKPFKGPGRPPRKQGGKKGVGFSERKKRVKTKTKKLRLNKKSKKKLKKKKNVKRSPGTLKLFLSRPLKKNGLFRVENKGGEVGRGQKPFIKTEGSVVDCSADPNGFRVWCWPQLTPQGVKSPSGFSKNTRRRTRQEGDNTELKKTRAKKNNKIIEFKTPK